MTKRQKEFKDKGWTVRSAAEVLGVSFSHLARVLADKRPSRSLVQRLEKLPAKNSIQSN